MALQLDCAGTHLHILLPGPSCQLALSEELCKLRLVIGVCIGRQVHLVSHFSLALGHNCIPAAEDRLCNTAYADCLTRNAARPQPIANGQGDVIGAADLQDVVPVLVGEVLRVVKQAQLQATAALLGVPALYLPDSTMPPSLHRRLSRDRTFAWMEPPRETMPVMRLAVRWM